MLVITRRRGESIMIGDGIEIRILRAGREGVRIGVVAPSSLPVHRQEIYQQICDANRAAAAPAPDAEQRAAIEALIGAPRT